MTRTKLRLLFLIYILLGLTNGFLNLFNFNKDKKTNGFLNLFNFNKDKGKSEKSQKSENQPFCKNCGKFDNSWNDMISLKLKETQFEKINKCKNNTIVSIFAKTRVECIVLYIFSLHENKSVNLKG